MSLLFFFLGFGTELGNVEFTIQFVGLLTVAAWCFLRIAV